MPLWPCPSFLISTADIHGSLDQLFRNILGNDQIHDINFNEMGTIPVNGIVEAAQASNSQATESRVGAEGTFLSNLLRQIMPIVSQNISETNNSAAEEALQDRSTGIPYFNVSFSSSNSECIYFHPWTVV